MNDAEIKTGVESVLSDKKNAYTPKNQMGVDAFDKLFQRVNSWAETKHLTQLPGNTDGKKRLAVVMYQQLRDKFVAVNDKFGPFPLKDLGAVPKQVKPTYTNLKQEFNAKKSDEVRAEVVKVLDIDDKDHPTHHNSFDSPQTLEKIIINVITPVKSDRERKRVGQLLNDLYHYTPTWRG